jgi:hypothetical protein
MRVSVAGVAACAAAFGVAGLASGAASYSDAAGDDNAAPDITSVQVSESPEGLVTIVVDVRNYQTLPAESWFNFWFDVDSDAETGEEGDEALVRFHSTGRIDFLFWNGSQLVERSPTGMTGRFAAGALTLTLPESAFGGLSSFGLLAVSARGQPFGEAEFVASDFAPDRGRSPVVGATPAAFADPGGDQDAAPDVTSVRVSDTKNGWISFAITTANYSASPGESVLIVTIDRDNRSRTGDSGADVRITSVGGLSGDEQVEQWDPAGGVWRQVTQPTRVRSRHAGDVTTIEIHRDELEQTRSFGFGITAIDFNVAAELVLGVDFAPEGRAYFRYSMVNKAALVLTATRLYASPARPRAGRPFAVNLAVRRSDTSRSITSGNVVCRAALDGRALSGQGRVVGGAGRCSFVLPQTAAGKRLRGTITVRVAGKSVAAGFAYVVRS